MACDCYQLELEPNPDIGGLGVLIGFLGTAWLSVVVVIVRYIMAFDPHVDPLHNPNSSPGSTWRPNPIDVRMTRIFKGLRARLGNQTRWQTPVAKVWRTPVASLLITAQIPPSTFNAVPTDAYLRFSELQVLLMMCDIQLLTGLGILLGGFIGLSCSVSAYHWQLIVYLAWFSNLTHAACLSSLRTYLYKNQTQRNWRMTLMSLLLAGLIAAIVLTAYFNWDGSLSESSASSPSSNARCFFTLSSAKEAWKSACSQNPSDSTHTRHHQRMCELRPPFSQSPGTISYESHIISLLLLTFNFTTRFTKMFRGLSTVARADVRDRISRLGLSITNTAIRLHRHYYSNNYPIIRVVLAIFRPLDIILSFYLLVKLYIDIFFSEICEVRGLQAW
ncbi:hypothetical protein CPLU01_12698 [Colletotrichum plurivorum]|uniref:Uncharacterized protein n=1 Tax=Colletotrichum plurivorum TaxID=2175906 RepID=A0A8H6JXT9_9PEZI|nr:hypothetical protein CPLU01_12698 [Colletotrichum plurivorum]